MQERIKLFVTLCILQRLAKAMDIITNILPLLHYRLLLLLEHPLLPSSHNSRTLRSVFPPLKHIDLVPGLVEWNALFLALVSTVRRVVISSASVIGLGRVQNPHTLSVSIALSRAMVLLSAGNAGHHQLMSLIMSFVSFVVIRAMMHVHVPR